MNKYVIKATTGETLYIHACYFRIEDNVINFYDDGMRFVSMCVMKNVICLYIENEPAPIPTLPNEEETT